MFRKLLPLLLVGALATAACSDADDAGDAEEASPTSTSAGAPEASAATEGAPAATEPAPDATQADATQSDDAESSEAAPSTGAAIGPDDVIVDLSDLLFDLAVLDVAVAGQIYGGEFLEPQLAAIDGLDPGVVEAIVASPILTTDGIDLEQLATIAPDAVTVTGFFTEFFEVSPELERIAPVLVVEDVGVDWREKSLAVGELVGRADDMQAIIDDAEAAIADLRARVEAEGLAGRTVSFLRLAPGGETFTTFARPSVVLDVIDAVGLASPDAVDVDQGDSSPFPGYAAQRIISAELVSEVEADVVMVGFVPDGAEPVDAVPGAETFVPALIEGRALDVQYFLWALNSVVGVQEIVEDLDRAVDLMLAADG
ncbi:MAG: ABC transporter substrate-binding protein [Actinomycetota bacterium]